MRLIFFGINPADPSLQPFRAPGQLAAGDNDVQRRDGTPHNFREHGRENQMVVSTQDDDFRLLWQQWFETLRQSHPGKTAAHAYNPAGMVWRAGCFCWHDQNALLNSFTRHAGDCNGETRKNEWGEHPIKNQTAELVSLIHETYASHNRAGSQRHLLLCF